MNDQQIQEHFERLFNEATDAGADTDWYSVLEWARDPWAPNDAVDQIGSILARREYETALQLLEDAGDPRFVPAREFVRGLAAGWAMRWAAIREDQDE